MQRSGFTTIEMIMVVVIMGVIAALGFPRIRDALQNQSRRSMRAGIVTLVATARSAAVARGCEGTVHFVSGANSRLWVTACKTQPGAPVAARDTLAGPYWTEARWDHRFQSGKDEIRYTPRGLRQSFVRTVILIRTKGDVTRDSVVVNELGKVVYP